MSLWKLAMAEDVMDTDVGENNELESMDSNSSSSKNLSELSTSKSESIHIINNVSSDSLKKFEPRTFSFDEADFTLSRQTVVPKKTAFSQNQNSSSTTMFQFDNVNAKNIAFPSIPPIAKISNLTKPLQQDNHSKRSAFRRKLTMPSPTFNFDLLSNDDLALKRCNSAPMLNDICDHEDYVVPWSFRENTTNTRLRRFSATIVSVNSSPSSGASKGSSRLNQLRKEESLEAIQHKETAREREVQVAMQMNSTCEELSLNDSSISATSSIGENIETTPQSKFTAVKPIIHSPQPVRSPSGRQIDFGISKLPQSSPIPIIPLHNMSPLLVPVYGGIAMPPSPTRSLPLTKVKQCFSPSMQISGLRDGSLSPSPSPTRKFVTRRRSQSPCLLRPSALGPIKRKYDSDSEGGCSSPKRLMVGMSATATTIAHGNQQEPSNHTTVFSHKTIIHRSHSLSSSSLDSDLNVSPSPPPIFHNSFLSTGVHLQHRRNTSSPLQSPLCHATSPLCNPAITAHQERICVSPTSSTCSSSSLEGAGLPLTHPFSAHKGNTKNVSTAINRVQHTSNLLS